MKAFWCGLLGGSLLIAMVLVVLFWIEGYNYTPIMVVNHTIDSTVICSKTDIIHELENKGIIITPQEYTNHISNYYNTILTFLVSLFVIFSVVTYFHLKYVAEEKIIKSVKELIINSYEVKDTIRNIIRGLADDEYIGNEEMESYVDQKISALEERIEEFASHDETIIQEDPPTGEPV